MSDTTVTVRPNTSGGNKTKAVLRNQFGAKFTLDKWETALDLLRKGKSPQAAADVIAVTRTTLVLWKDRSEAMRKAWDDAIAGGTDLIEDEAHRRAVEGVAVDVYGSLGGNSGTGVVGTKIEYSDALLNMILKAKRPEKYRDNFTVSGDPNSPIRHRVVVEFVAGQREPEPKTIEHE